MKLDLLTWAHKAEILGLILQFMELKMALTIYLTGWLKYGWRDCAL